uniref:Non-toxic non-hemmagglutinin n=1 Tax=Clostridium botulinum C TaxID=36828 RepID=A0A0A1EFM4_CLOBO|nr:non-toxic non-hemmagglutinin [Clostridium botulinum C]AIY29266.1 non-toxic non-hemmagglutinin [Clostridium botulinum C]
MDINDDLNINSPVDNKNVVIVRARKTNTFFKAFKVAPNIWVAPERYYGEPLDIAEEYKLDGGIYDSNFLSQDSERENFLQAIIILLKRINNTISGKQLLSLISTAIPFPYGYIGGGYSSPNIFTFGKTPKSNKKLNSLVTSTIPFPFGGYRETNYIESQNNKNFYASNIVIFGPGSNIVENNVIYYKKNDAENGMGTMAEILFQPLLTYKYNKFYIDPAMELTKCLIKSLYFLYGIKPSDNLVVPYRLRTELDNKQFSQLNIIDLLISGGVDLEFINTNPYWFTNSYFPNSIKMFEKYKNIYKTEIEGNNAIGNDIKLRLKQKFQINVQDIWNLNLNYFCQSFNSIIPDRFSNALKHFYRKQYYTMDYTDNYNINGFVNGQINTRLPLSNKNTNIISKPEKVVNLVNENNISLMKSNIYGDGLKGTTEDFYSTYKIPYNEEYEYRFNDSDNFPLNNISIEEVDSIPEIIDINPYKDNSDNLVFTQITSMTEEVTTHTALSINYLQAQITNNENFTLSSDFSKVVSSKDKSLVYSFLDNLMSYLETIKNDGPIDTDKKYYLWLKEVFKNYSFDINLTQEIDSMCGINEVVLWFGKALNILNTSNSFVEEYQDSGAISLISKKDNLREPNIEIDDISDSLLGLSFKDLNNKLYEIYSKNIVYFKKIYFSFLDQWWTEYYSQYFQLICMAKQSILAQESLVKQIVQNKFTDLSKASIPPDTLKLIRETTEKTFIDLSNESQISMNRVDNFLNKASICVFVEDIYPKFISYMEKYINNINIKTREFIQRCTNINDNEKSILINSYTFKTIDFKFLDIQSIKNFFNSQVEQVMKEILSPYQLLLFASKGPNSNIIEDISGKNTLIQYTESIELVYGVNGESLYLKSPNETIKFSNKFFTNGLTNNFTICFWLRFTGKNDDKTRLIGNKVNNCGWEIYFEDNGLVFEIIDSNGNQESVYLSNIINDNWYYISISVDRLKDQLLIFINDKNVANVSIDQILSIYSTNIISLVNKNNSIYVEELSVLDKPITSEEVIRNYFSYLDNSYIRDSSKSLLEYNKNYQLYNYVFPETSLYEVNDNNKSYLSLKNTDGINISSIKFKLINIDESKVYVQKWDECIICVLDGTEKYLDISPENNRIQLVSSKDNAKKITVNTDLFRPDCITFSYNDKYFSLSLRDGDYNWMICNDNNKVPKGAHLWILKS